MAGPRDEAPPSDLDDVFAIVDRLPFLGNLKRDLTHLRKLLYDRRTPRVLAMGAKESGRTSIANALLRLPAIPLGAHEAAPADRWIRIDAGGRHLDWLEVESGALEGGREAAVRRALDESAPDLIVAIVRADAVDAEGAAAKQTIAQIRAMLEDVPAAAKPPVLGVIARVDAIARPEATEQGGVRFSTDDLGKIDAATLALKTLLESGAQEKLKRPVPVLAGGSTPDGAPPPRWNVTEVADAIHDALPDEAKVEAVRALDVRAEIRRELARTIVNHCSAAAVTVGLMPVPFSDAVLLLPLQGVMVSAVAYLAGQPWDRRAGLEWLGSVGVMGGAAFGLRWGAQQLVKLIPGAGTLVAGSVAGAGTLAMGRSAIAYFVDGPGRREPHLELPADVPRP